MFDVTEILTAARELTVTGMALVGVVALAKGWVVTKPHHDEIVQTLKDRITVQTEIIRRLKNGEHNM